MSCYIFRNVECGKTRNSSLEPRLGSEGARGPRADSVPFLVQTLNPVAVPVPVANFLVPFQDVKLGVNYNPVIRAFTVPINGTYELSALINWIFSPLTQLDEIQYSVNFSINGVAIVPLMVQDIASNSLDDPILYTRSQRYDMLLQLSVGDEVQVVVSTFLNSGTATETVEITGTFTGNRIA